MAKKIKARGYHLSSTGPAPDKARIVALAEQLHRDHLVGDAHVPGSCLHWTMAVIDAAARNGLRLIPQAGSASFQRLPRYLDDGAPTTLTHFSYEWHGGDVTKLPDGRLILPEIHVWAADPARGEIVDLSTRHLAEMCETTAGLPWLDVAPPPYLWSRELPAGWLYQPNREATELAVRYALALISERARGRRPC